MLLTKDQLQEGIDVNEIIYAVNVVRLYVSDAKCSDVDKEVLGILLCQDIGMYNTSPVPATHIP